MKYERLYLPDKSMKGDLAHFAGVLARPLRWHQAHEHYSAVFFSKKMKSFAVYFKNHFKIVSFTLIPIGPSKVYYPHIIVAARKANPRLRSSLFYL